MTIEYGTSTALTITAANLSAGANRSSAAVTTSTDKNVVGIIITVRFNLNQFAMPTLNRAMVVYAYTSEDGTKYTGNSSTVDNVDGTNKALTAIGSPSNLICIGFIPIHVTGSYTVVTTQSFEITSLIGYIPAKWGIVLHNVSNAAFGTTGSVSYREVYYSL